jgi:hypothetical protein
MKNDSNSKSTIASVLKEEQEFQEEKKALAEKSKVRIAQKQKQLQQQMAQLQSEYVSQSQDANAAETQPNIDQSAVEKQVKEVLKKKSKQVTEAIISYLPA